MTQAQRKTQRTAMTWLVAAIAIGVAVTAMRGCSGTSQAADRSLAAVVIVAPFLVFWLWYVRKWPFSKPPAE
jgi:hypothetical protein